MMNAVLKCFGLGLAAMALLAVTPMSSQADLIQNGSFEVGPFPGGHLTLNAGSTAIAGWTVVGAGLESGENIDYIGTTWVASDGSRSLDLNGYYKTGGIRQGFDTTVGQAYLVTFDMAGNPDPRPTINKTMQVSAIGDAIQSGDFSFDITGKTTKAMGWTTMDWMFVADASYTTLQFMSTVTGSIDAWGPALDNVRVSAVPVPGAALLGVVGLGFARWNLRRRRAA